MSQLIHILKNIIRLSFCLFHHINGSLTGQHQAGYGTSILSNGNIGIKAVTHTADLLVGDSGISGDDIDHITVRFTDEDRFHTGCSG